VSRERSLITMQIVHRPLDEVFAFFAEPRNLARITPPSLRFRLVAPEHPVMARGLVLRYRIRSLGVPMTWVSEITEYDPPREFVDVQRRGPYAAWHHRHTFRAIAEGTEVADVVTYRLPFGAIGAIAHPVVRRQLDAIFAYRKSAINAAFGTPVAF
jgi:ligand-binding SRPBCC domain-containing protein